MSICCTNILHNSCFTNTNPFSAFHLFEQRSYHPNPGISHRSAHQTCYLPATQEGNDLLLPFQYAFLHGLTFTVGTSLTTNTPNLVTWSSIHHKTSPSGGAIAYGFPDTSYFSNCNKKLDDLYVPSALELKENKKEDKTK
jgi:hypothetical protein